MTSIDIYELILFSLIEHILQCSSYAFKGQNKVGKFFSWDIKTNLCIFNSFTDERVRVAFIHFYCFDKVLRLYHYRLKNNLIAQRLAGASPIRVLMSINVIFINYSM